MWNVNYVTVHSFLKKKVNREIMLKIVSCSIDRTNIAQINLYLKLTNTFLHYLDFSSIAFFRLPSINDSLS